MPKFFLNYGGPGGSYLSQDPEKIDALELVCQQEYSGAKRAIGGTVKGISFTVHTYGVHRALTCEIPENASAPVQRLYETLLQSAREEAMTDYNLTGHNCVTSVAKVLNELDPYLTPADMVAPWNLDSNLNEYNQAHLEDTTAAQFIGAYKLTKRQEALSFMRIRTWDEEQIMSLMTL